MALGLGLYADFGRLGDELAGFRWELFPLALALTALNYVIRFWRWQRYLSRLSIDVPAKNGSTNGEAQATLSAASMSNASLNACQGATFTIPVTLSGASG